MNFADELKERMKESEEKNNAGENISIDDKEIAKVTDDIKRCIMQRAQTLTDLGENTLDGFICLKYSENICRRDLIVFPENRNSRILVTGENCMIETFGVRSAFVVKLCDSLESMIASMGFDNFSVQPVIRDIYLGGHSGERQPAPRKGLFRKKAARREHERSSSRREQLYTIYIKISW